MQSYEILGTSPIFRPLRKFIAMKVFHRAADLQRYLKGRRSNNRSIGFVPTMGALHRGHLSLVEQSAEDNQLTVVSIFVNPTQFNDPGDLEKYPRTPGRDLEFLAAAGCEVVFLPSVDEVYPPDLPHNSQPLDFSSLDKVMEGAMRPGHFNGVAQVVERLLQLTQPNVLYLGQKDYQQVAIVRSMIRQRGIDVAVVMSPTVRENDGLALSSRNVRLDAEGRKRAPELYRILSQCQAEILEGTDPVVVARRNFDLFAAVPGLKPEYLGSRRRQHFATAYRSIHRRKCHCCNGGLGRRSAINRQCGDQIGA